VRRVKSEVAQLEICYLIEDVKSDVPAVIARCDSNFAPKYVREVAWARIAHVEPDFDHALRRLSQ